MNISDTNRLYDVVGGFVGLGEDDELYVRFRDFDIEDEDALADVVREFLLPDLAALERRRKLEGLAVLERVASEPEEEQAAEWDAMMPPFPYPKTVNLFELIHRTLTGA